MAARKAIRVASFFEDTMQKISKEEEEALRACNAWDNIICCECKGQGRFDDAGFPLRGQPFFLSYCGRGKCIADESEDVD